MPPFQSNATANTTSAPATRASTVATTSSSGVPTPRVAPGKSGNYVPNGVTPFLAAPSVLMQNLDVTNALFSLSQYNNPGYN